MRQEDADWERRRSRSPLPMQGADLGLVLLSGSLLAAEGAPPPPLRHPDPMLDFFKETCTGEIGSSFNRQFEDYDPMIAEVLAACAEAVNKPLSFSPARSPMADEPHSPVYIPNAANWSKIAEFNEEAASLGYNNMIHFGPGVQQEIDGQVTTTGITEQVAELILKERRSAIVDSILVPCEQPILETPAVPKQQSKVSRRAKNIKTSAAALRRSTRQKANLCSVPVSKRATHRLIKVFGIVGPDEPIGEDALEAYAKTFSTPLSQDQIAAVRRLTSLDSGAVTAAAAQLVAAEGADAMGS